MGKSKNLKIAKSISMDLDLFNMVLEESEIMSRDFSGTISTLIKIGLSVRRDQRAREEEAIKNAARTA